LTPEPAIFAALDPEQWPYACRKKSQASNTAASIATIGINICRACCEPASAITKTARAKSAPKTIADIGSELFRSTLSGVLGSGQSAELRGHQ